MRAVVDVEVEQLATLVALLSDAVAGLEADAEIMRGDLRRWESDLWLALGALIVQRDDLAAGVAHAEAVATNFAGWESTAERKARESREAFEAAAAESPPPEAPVALKDLYRQVARAVHPDLGPDEDRERRTSAMADAAAAFERRDGDALARILADFASNRLSSAAIEVDADVRAVRLRGQVAALRARQRELSDELAAMATSEIARLAAEADSGPPPRWSALRTRIEAEIVDLRAELAAAVASAGSAQ